ncbi:MAG: carbamoyltransferase HypF [bacterium]
MNPASDRSPVGGTEPVLQRLQLEVRGLVQGVGFRPFVYRLANMLQLTGSVRNNSQGVQIEIEGATTALSEFQRRLVAELPPLARIDSVDCDELPLRGDGAFSVGRSDASGASSALVLPDMATCPDCLSEILDPGDRRYRYPFTNCTNCGPRLSIIESLPYDRRNTTMSEFVMCAACRAEYEDPTNRRFHAQPNACRECGPGIELRDSQGNQLAGSEETLSHTCRLLREGRIVALKGLGGFQLLVDARSDSAVQELRRRKARPSNPLAVMFPTLTAAATECEITESEATLLQSPQAPIVLLRRHLGVSQIAESVAPGNPCLGVMLPYTPLHHLLMRDLGFPIIATSGNFSDEPICIDNDEALRRLGGIADYFLIHNRPVARQMDDSVIQVVDGEVMILRHARGLAPTSIPMPTLVEPVLALGGHLKNSVAVGQQGVAVLGQHIGDLETREAIRAFERESESLQRLHNLRPTIVVTDDHPDYYSSVHGESLQKPLCRVQHHLAHVLSCMAEHQLEPPALGIAWDGTGLGSDGTIWGGEFILVEAKTWQRAAHLREFSLPGGDAASRDPRRSALALLYEMLDGNLSTCGDALSRLSLSPQALKTLEKMLTHNINCTRTSSVGRLFDSVAALTGICLHSTFEGEAAMRLQFAAEQSATRDSYKSGPFENHKVDWQPMIEGVLGDLEADLPLEDIALKFHRTLAHLAADVVSAIGISPVVLSGGCFQNRLLLTLTSAALREQGITVYSHHCVPPNDGGLALGQLLAATLDLQETR